MIEIAPADFPPMTFLRTLTIFRNEILRRSSSANDDIVLFVNVTRVLHIILAVLIIKRERDTETLEQKKRMNLWTSSNVVLSYLRGLAAATTLVATVATSNPEEAVAQPDLFIMAMSYQPEFCFQHKKAGYSGCQHPRDFWKKSLTIHGLWPEVRTELVLCLFS